MGNKISSTTGMVKNLEYLQEIYLVKRQTYDQFYSLEVMLHYHIVGSIDYILARLCGYLWLSIFAWLIEILYLRYHKSRAKN